MPTRPVEVFFRVYEPISKTRNVVIVVLSATTLCLYLAVAFLRNFPIAQAGWLDELTRFLNVWVIMLGAGAAMRLGGHASLDFLVKALPAAVAPVVVALVDLALIAFLVLLVAVSVPLVSMNWAQQSTMLSMIDADWLQGWPVSMGWPYLAIPVGLGLMILDVIAFRLSPLADAPAPSEVEAGI